MWFPGDILAGVIAAGALTFLVIALISYHRSRAPALPPVAAVLAIMALKNVLVLLDSALESLDGALGGWYHFILDLLLLIVLVAMSRPGGG